MTLYTSVPQRSHYRDNLKHQFDFEHWFFNSEEQ